MSVIETRGLTKRYGETRGIQNVDLRVKGGEIFGFLGPSWAINGGRPCHYPLWDTDRLPAMFPGGTAGHRTGARAHLW
jgi:hypothetical protein